jgi:hypothetical protein
MLIIGFGSKARNGKDTAAEAIRDYYERRNAVVHNGRLLFIPGTQVAIFKFATALYQEVEDLIRDFGLEQVFSGKFELPVPNAATKTPVEEGVVPSFDIIRIPSWVTSGDPTPAPMAKYGKHTKLLQWWGTDYRRTHFGMNYWVDRLFASIPANLDIALISDTRFPNETDGIKQRGGYTVQVQRLHEDGTQYFSSDRSVDHPSETALDGYNWDYYLKAKSGEIAWVQKQAIALVRYLRSSKDLK